MWPDNESEIDLIGFDYLVDELEVLLTNERLLPLTVLVSGDWGSGKSSLMEVARQRLERDENKDRFICVKFTPWRFEDFNYGKVALMAAVVDAIADYADEHETVLQEAAGLAKKLRRKLHAWGVWRHSAAIGAAAAGAGPEEIAAAGAAAEVVGGAGTADDDPARAFETVAHFHTEFEELIESLGDKLQAVVVFIDDMDRCSNVETIVETFEAMRLFMHAPKTAYVVGAHEDIVEAALDRRYEGRREGDEELGSHWLEKMLQHPIKVPPLGEPEVLGYINLLFAELHTSPEDFEKLRSKADENRKRNPFQVAMNAGIARDTIGDLSEELTEALDIAGQVGPLLAQNLRGNPRETKRFLNRFLLRMATARKRSLDLDAARLAKLMVLEELLDAQHFERVFTWHLASDTGAPKELAVAERLANEEQVKGAARELQEWVRQPDVARWLRLQPSLAETNLAPYFTFSRDRLGSLITAPRLSQELQRLLAELHDDSVDPLRVKAVEQANELSERERDDLVPALLDAAAQNLSGGAAKSLRELARERSEVATAMFSMLEKLSVRKVTGNFALDLATDFKRDPRTKPLLEKWAGTKSNADLKRQAERALAKF